MQRWALQAVREDARRVRREIAERALKATPSAGPGGGGLRPPRRRIYEDCRRLEAFMRTLSREKSADMAGIALAVRQLRSLAERSRACDELRS